MDHSKEFLAIVESCKGQVRELSVSQANDRQSRGATLVDVREDSEWNDGHAAGAVHVGKGVIERDAVKSFPKKDAELLLYCGGGYRSILAADALQKMGYTNVFSVAGGWKAWKQHGLPTEE